MDPHGSGKMTKFSENIGAECGEKVRWKKRVGEGKEGEECEGMPSLKWGRNREGEQEKDTLIQYRYFRKH